MTKTIKNTHTEFHSDKLDVSATSGLSLLFYPERLIIIAKNQNGSVIGVNDYPFVDSRELELILEKDLFIAKEGKTCDAQLHIYSPDFCLVPSVLFDPSEANTYLNFSREPQDATVFYSGLDNDQIVVVGGIDKSLIKIFSDHLPNLQLLHGGSLAINYLLQEKSLMLNQELAIVIEDKQIYLAGFANKELKFFNRFDVRSNQEFLKYTFGVLHQLAFDRMHCKMTIFGNIEEVNVQEEILHRYFKNVVISVPKSNQNYLPGAEEFKETKKLAAFWTN